MNQKKENYFKRVYKKKSENEYNKIRFKKENLKIIKAEKSSGNEDKALIELQKILIKIYEEKNDVRKRKWKKNKNNLIELGEEINIIYNLFEDVVYYKIDELDDDSIFNRKVILKLIKNHKEYLTTIYDLKYPNIYNWW